MNIIQDFIPIGRRNRPRHSNPMQFITIHNTGNTSKGATARNHAIYLKGDAAANAPVSWHYTVDDENIFHHIPDNESAFHAGDGNGAGNRKSIGIEICMNSDGDLLKATNNAAWLTAELCREHGIPIENVVQHNNWSGKNCPQLIRAGKPYNWSVFIEKVSRYIEKESDTVTQEQFEDMFATMMAKQRGDNPSEWAQEATAVAQNSGLFVGDGDGNFNWDLPITREAMAIICFRLGLIK